MSGHQNRIKTGPAVVVRADLGTQNARNRVIYEHWQQDRLVEARGILADIGDHSDTLVLLACQVICAHGPDPVERADALGMMRLLSARLPETADTAPKGGAA
jgi:hypothetical protein